jgi:bifunctional UDP-N-acetylglucosamine pyrophosphorylase/glucosamine-1-phosphate N-acetyltransferase
MSDKIGIAILAAGLGKRMGKNLPKPLVGLLGKSLVDFPLKASLDFAQSHGLEAKVGIVVGHQKELVEEHIQSTYKGESSTFSFPEQKEQLGTADALKSYFSGCPWAADTEYTLVLCADTPLLTDHELSVLWSEIKKDNSDGVCASFHESNPTGYGRIIRAEKGFQIVEEKDASAEQRAIKEVNSGLYLFKTEYIVTQLASIESNNKANEFYLTDSFGKDQNVSAFCFEDSTPFLGVNGPKQLEKAGLLLREKINCELQENGVEIIDSSSTFIEPDVKVGRGSIIYPQTYLHGATSIGEDCVLEPGCIIKDSHLSSGVTVKAYSYLEGAKAAEKCSIGPFARLRQGSELGEKVKIGNYVEVKKAKLEKSVSVSHLSYVGDAEIGENVNIGCGFITCNYDGESKHKTIIGKNSFIGSDTQMIAPVEIGESVFVASGSTINQDVPSFGFALSRARQVIKEKMASRFLKGKWAVKK